MVMRVVMESLVVELERVVGVDLFFFWVWIHSREASFACPMFVLFVTLICLYPSIQELLGCAVLIKLRCCCCSCRTRCPVCSLSKTLYTKRKKQAISLPPMQ
jgi:hypothetical protein